MQRSTLFIQIATFLRSSKRYEAVTVEHTSGIGTATPSAGLFQPHSTHPIGLYTQI